MVKIQFSDVTPPERRSIRDIPIPNSGKRKTPIVIKPETLSGPKLNPISNNFNEPVPSPSPIKISDMTDIKDSKAYEYYYPKNKKEPEMSEGISEKSNKKRFIFGGIIFVVIVFFLISMMTVFASATAIVTPKSQTIQVSMDLIGTAERDDSSIRYEVIKLSKSQTVSIPATTEESVKLQAHGKIVVYNNFSTEPQRLIVRTRFESGDGLIYRIPESIIVPGKSVQNGVATPGSIETEVFADEAGEKYNIKKADFTIPGFKNDALRYQNFYARSVSDMTGGFVGKRKTLPPNDKQVALQKISIETQTLLAKELQSKVPEGLVLLSNAITYEVSELPQQEESSDVVVGEEVTSYALMLNSQDLSDKIIAEYKKSYPDWTNIPAFAQDFSLLNITKRPDKIEVGQKINFQISGKAKMLAKINTDLISQKFVGLNKKDINGIINEFAGIKSIVVTVRPIWKQSFPNNPSKIKVKTVTE